MSNCIHGGALNQEIRCALLTSFVVIFGWNLISFDSNVESKPSAKDITIAGHIIGDLPDEAITETDFKYLGILQGTLARVSGLDYAPLSDILRCVKLILKSHRLRRNKVSAMYIFAIP